MLLNIGASSLLLRTDQKKKTCNVSTRPSLRTPLNFAPYLVIYIPIFPYSLLCPFLNILLSSPFPHDLSLPIDPPFKFISFLFPFFLSRSVSHFPLIRYRLTVLILPSCELFLNPPPSLTYPLLFPISFSPCYSLILLFSSFIPSSLVYLLIPFFPLSLLSPVPSFHTHPTSARPLPPPFPIFSITSIFTDFVPLVRRFVSSCLSKSA